MTIELNTEQAEYLNKLAGEKDYYSEGNSIEMEEFPPSVQLRLEQMEG